MSELLIPEARCVDTGEIVQPSAKDLRPGRVAYGPWHKGRLRCKFCDAAIHQNAGTPIIASGHHGRQPHFVSNPGSRHEDCVLPPRPQDSRKTEYDDTKGYRIHINTLDYSDQFNLAAGPYYRDDEGRLKLKDESLKKWKPQAIREIGDVADLIRHGDFERLNKSVVMLGDREKPLPWHDFLIRYNNRPNGNNPRYEALADRALCKEFYPAAMEIITDGARGNRVPSRPIAAGFLHGRPLTLIPQVWLDNNDDTRVKGSMQRAGRYLVLGVPQISRPQEYRDGLARYLNIRVTDIRQVMQADLAKLADEGMRKSERRRKSPALAAE